MMTYYDRSPHVREDRSVTEYKCECQSPASQEVVILVLTYTEPP